jgi:hypothetical protein
VAHRKFALIFISAAAKSQPGLWLIRNKNSNQAVNTGNYAKTTFRFLSDGQSCQLKYCKTATFFA